MIDKFIKYLRYEKCYSSHTLFAYESDLRLFELYYVENYGTFEYDKVSNLEIRSWIVEMKSAGEKISTVNRRISCLRSFYKFCKRQNGSLKNPVTGIVSLKKERRIPMFLKHKETEKLLKEPNEDENFENFRNFMVIETFYSLGLRSSELVNLKDVDFDFDRCNVVINGKGKKQRVLPLTERFIKLITKYIGIRDKEFEKTDGYVFVKKNGEQMNYRQVYTIVHKKISEVSTISKQSPHVLRHTYASDLLNEGADIQVVRDLLGHSSLAATQVYTHTTFEQKKKRYKSAHPRAIKSE